jgi:tRNA modification GTPase
MSRESDTIAAVATPPGRGGVGIIRVSGPKAATIATLVLRLRPRPRHAVFRPFRGADGQPIDSGIALFFAGPHSFTGEDVLELHGHGGPVVLDMVLQRVLTLGARLAHPGEFSQRAFLNGKIDLAQAEAIADLIDSASTQAARSAQRSLEGEFSRKVQALADRVAALRMRVEASIDFPEEEIELLPDGELDQALGAVRSDVVNTLACAEQGRLLREGVTVVIAGRPNVGKSSLLNRLAGQERAIVTDIPGTTRDALREHLQLDGLPLHLIDTAGLREAQDRVERQGIHRAWEAIRAADATLLVVDDREDIGSEERDILGRLPSSPAPLLVRNKIDLTTNKAPSVSSGEDVVRVSAKTGAGIPLLRRRLKELVGYQRTLEGSFLARRRHLEALQLAESHLAAAQGQLRARQTPELVAEDLRQAQRALGEILGQVTSEDLLDQIFSSFCIGK